MTFPAVFFFTPGGLGLEPVTVRVAQEVLNVAPMNVALRPKLSFVSVGIWNKMGGEDVRRGFSYKVGRYYLEVG